MLKGVCEYLQCVWRSPTHVTAVEQIIKYYKLSKIVMLKIYKLVTFKEPNI